MQLHCLNTQQSKDSLSCTNQYFSVTIFFKTNVMVPHRKQTAISEALCFRVAQIAGWQNIKSEIGGFCAA